MRSFLRLLVALCLVIATAHLLRQSGALIALKSALEPHGKDYRASLALFRNDGTEKPMVFGDSWFQKQLGKACDGRPPIFVTVPQTFFKDLADLVAFAAVHTSGPIVVQIGNYTWFPNRDNRGFNFDYLPASEPFSPVEAWQSTGRLFGFVEDLARRDNTGRARKPKEGYYFASADLNGLATLAEAARAAPGRLFLVSADKHELKDVTPRQIARRDEAILMNRDLGLYSDIATFAAETGCAPLRSSQHRTSQKKHKP